MASIVDSFREVFSDNFSFFKLAIFTAPAYYNYILYTQAMKNNDFGGFNFMLWINVLLFLGFLVKITGNVINERDRILPSLNPFSILLSSLKGILAIGIYAWISIAIANYLCSLINIVQWVDIALQSIIWLVVVSIILAAFLMFSRHERILDAYNLKMLSDKAGDLIVVVLFFLLQLAVINIPTIGFLGYTLLILFGFGPIFDVFVAYAIVFNIAVLGHYMGQVHYETFSYNKQQL